MRQQKARPSLPVTIAESGQHDLTTAENPDSIRQAIW
ncbi:uncharacterized protein G2W53_001673 [Senna tora]|uniref:Uncharacterized protein n=1 Tax=Senna tora TaxID=362788 RepID=A0A834XK72_9FABA|nr:uncharacterized protein G2W53_001673 [Senna tora]